MKDDDNMAAFYHIYTCHFLWFTPNVGSSRISLLDLHHFLLDDDIPWHLILQFCRHYLEDKDSYGMFAPVL
jgi:hypothetical protein